jgi:hypothetical protein
MSEMIYPNSAAGIRRDIKDHRYSSVWLVTEDQTMGACPQKPPSTSCATISKCNRSSCEVVSVQKEKRGPNLHSEWHSVSRLAG